MQKDNTCKQLNNTQRQLIEDYYKEYGERHIRYCISQVVQCNLNPEIMDDYIGIAEMAICKAAKNYNKTKGMKFSGFVRLNITSAIATYLRDENTLKRRPIGGIDSLDRVVDKENKTTFGELLEYVEKEEVVSNVNNISSYVKSLSKMETVVLVLRLLGVRTQEIIEHLNEPPKKIKAWLKGISSYDKKDIIKKKGEIQ